MTRMISALFTLTLTLGLVGCDDSTVGDSEVAETASVADDTVSMGEQELVTPRSADLPTEEEFAACVADGGELEDGVLSCLAPDGYSRICFKGGSCSPELDHCWATCRQVIGADSCCNTVTYPDPLPSETSG